MRFFEPLGLRGKYSGYLAICALALALRLAALIPFSMHHPDEIFQYLEPAHRLAFGQGVVTWEYRYGMRGWLLPTLLSWPMTIGALLAPHGQLYLFLPRLIVSLGSMSIPMSAFAIGSRISRHHAYVAITVMAIWPETIYFSAHVLSEEVAVALFMPAAALMLTEAAGVRRLVLAGLLFGLAISIRFHYAPAVAAMALAYCGRALRARWLPLIAGGGAALVLAGLADIVHGATPFAWILVNFSQNVVQDRAAQYGTAPPIFYLASLAYHWLWMFPLILFAVRPAARSNLPLFLAAITNVLVLSAIGHKEYRFILLSTTILVLLASLGSVDLLKRSAERLGSARLGGLLAGLVLFWAAGSASLAAFGPINREWTQGSPELALADRASQIPELCGLALHMEPFWKTGGYTYLNRGVPIYLTYLSDADRMSSRELSVASRSFNAMIAPGSALRDVPKDFGVRECRGQGDLRACLMTRPGKCASRSAAHWEIQAALLRHDF